MRWTRKQKAVKATVKFSFTFGMEECSICGDTVWLEPIYELPNTHKVCRRCCPTREDAYDYFCPEVLTVLGVLERNLQRQLNKERQKVVSAVQGLKNTIGVAMAVENEEMNPTVMQLQMETVTAAENTLREIDNANSNSKRKER
jgi:hypothetical protein